MKAVLILAVLIAAATVATATPFSAKCVLDTTTAGPKESVKSCSRCAWQCLTDDHCNTVAIDDVSYTRAELADVGVTCGDGYFLNATLSGGLCVLYDANSAFIGQIFDTQEQTCAECAQQCNTDSRCTSFEHNGVAYANGDTCAGTPPVVPIVPVAVPSPVPVIPSPVPVIPSPVPVIPSPVPVIPSPKPVIPSPKPVIPSPVPVIPSPVPVIPSPVPVIPSPSPALQPQSTGIVVRPGKCNYDIIKYEVEVITTFVATLDSDDCCEACKNSTTPCNVASLCFDSEDNGGCGVGCVTNVAAGVVCQGDKYPRYTCQLGFATLGADGFPTEETAPTAPEAKGWVTVTVTPTNTPDLYP